MLLRPGGSQALWAIARLFAFCHRTAVVFDSDTVMGAGSSCTKADATRCLVPAPPHDPLRPTRATHMLYVQELEAYLIHVATYPDAFQKKVEKRRDAPLDW